MFWLPKVRLVGESVTIGAPFTTCIRIELVCGTKLASPRYIAVMLWLPTLSVDVEKVATPELRAEVPSVVLPSRKVTLPVGDPDPPMLALTVAVNVTGWPVAE